MRVTSLGSGSSGNAYLIEAGPGGRTRLLVDAGFQPRVLLERLRLAGCTPGQLQGVLVTHEHSDHIIGLPTLLKRYRVPVYSDQRTLAEIRAILSSGVLRTESGALVSLEAEFSANSANGTGLLVREERILFGSTPMFAPAGEASKNTSDLTPGGNEGENMPLLAPGSDEGATVPMPAGEVSESASLSIPIGGEGAFPPESTQADDERAAAPATEFADDGLWRTLPIGMSRVIGDIEAQSFPVSHDAVAPCGYVLNAGGCRVCIVTDSGEVTPVMLAAIAQADLLILESNHDRARLLSGPYPYYLKQRILSPTGHLSNDQAAEAVLRTWRYDGVRWLWLAHLSRTNNTPRLALSSMQKSLRRAGANLAQIHISALKHEMGQSWDSKRLWQDTHLWELPQ